MMNLYNTAYFGDYCKGGDFVPAVNQAGYDETFELESNFPYENWQAERYKHNSSKSWTYKRKVTYADKYLHLKEYQANGCPTVTVKIFDA